MYVPDLTWMVFKFTAIASIATTPVANVAKDPPSFPVPPVLLSVPTALSHVAVEPETETI